MMIYGIDGITYLLCQSDVSADGFEKEYKQPMLEKLE